MTLSCANIKEKIDEAIERVVRDGERVILQKDGKDVAAVVPMSDLRQMEKAPEGKPIWEVIMELGNQIPEEELAKLPTDLSINLDHYLYGAPKVTE